MGRGRRTGRGNRYLRDGELREAGLRAILLATDRDRYSGSCEINLTGDYHWRRAGRLITTLEGAMQIVSKRHRAKS